MGNAVWGYGMWNDLVFGLKPKGVVMREENSNKSSLTPVTLRGTEPTRNQIIPDLGYADVGDIVRDGLAIDQIVDLYNYWQQLKAPQGASYQVAELETLYTETARYLAAKAGQYIPGANLAAEAYIAYLRSRTDIVIDEPTGMVRKINLNHTSTEIYSDERRFGLGINPASVTVVGHSLGGHLAADFSRLFPKVADNYKWVINRRLAA